MSNAYERDLVTNWRFSIGDSPLAFCVATIVLHIQLVQPVPEKMTPEIVTGIQNGFLSGRRLYFFSNEPFEKRPVMIIQSSNLHSNRPFQVSSFRKRATQTSEVEPWTGMYPLSVSLSLCLYLCITLSLSLFLSLSLCSCESLLLSPRGPMYHVFFL